MPLQLFSTNFSFTGYRVFFQLWRMSGSCSPSILFSCPEELLSTRLSQSPEVECAHSPLPRAPSFWLTQKARGGPARSSPSRPQLSPMLSAFPVLAPEKQTCRIIQAGGDHWGHLPQAPISSRANLKIRSNFGTRQQAKPITADGLGRLLRASCPWTATASPGWRHQKRTTCCCLPAATSQPLRTSWCWS